MKIAPSRQFKKDVKKIGRQNKAIRELKKVIECLFLARPLENRHRDHKLLGRWGRHRECHILPDLLLIYRLEDNTLFLERLGTHADLFG